jgi:hypothetical protein
MAENTDPMLNTTDLSDQGTVQFQERRIEKLDAAQAAIIANDAQEALAKASGPKQILDIILTVGQTIMKVIAPLMLLLAVNGCIGTRPPPIMKVGEFKQTTFNQAIGDWKVRADANCKAIEVRGQAKIESTFESNVAKAKNIEVGPDGAVFVVVIAPTGEKLKRPIDQFIKDVVALKESETAKLKEIIAEERGEDAKIAEKFAAVAAMNQLELRYFEKVESGTLTPEVASQFVTEFTAIIAPMLAGGKK